MTYVESDLSLQERGGNEEATPTPNMPGLDGGEYLRQRLDPHPGDPFYLVLSDLRLAMEELRPAKISRLLDYGCGGSPYRPLFSGCTYHRADLAGGRDLDFEYGPDSGLSLDVSDYDCVLSTQVLEHVVDPQAYLRECWRVLRPGGQLILTTHGLFEDHACPEDYWRWTVYGLMRLVESVGFKVDAAKKVTTGPRGVMFLAERELPRLRFKEAGLYGSLLSLGMKAVGRLGSRRRHQASDRSFSHCRVVDFSEAGHDMYIVVALRASR
jgi:SAM-dependent methyltransferase